MHAPHEPRSPLSRAYLLLALGIFFISFSAIFTKWTNLPSVTSGFYRLAIAEVALALPFYRRRRQHPPLDRRVLALALPGEALFPLQVIGGILAFIGIYIVNRFGR
jgi:drug/metabolite transporter (DMT)-like permease